MSNQSIVRPLAVAYGAQSEDGSITFFTLRKEVTFSDKVAEITSVLRWCNGHRQLEDVRIKSCLEPDEFEMILQALVENGVIVDSCALGLLYHENSMYPLLTGNDLSPSQIRDITQASQKGSASKSSDLLLPAPMYSDLLSIIKSRKSSREFGKDSVSLDQLSTLLESTYGQGASHNSVPSAGGLYPLRIFVLLLKKTGKILPGCYEYMREMHSLRHVTQQASSELANFLLDSEGTATDASVVLFIGATLEIITKKYANRAYRLVLLEAGHAVQNAYLSCAEQRLGILECGGFNDLEVSRYLGLTFPNQPIVTTLVIGTVANLAEESRDDYANSEWKLRHELMTGETKIVTSLTSSTHHYKAYTMPRYVVVAEYASSDPETPKEDEKFNTSTGAGFSLQEATVKALGEAFERQVSGNVRTDIICTRNAVPYPVYDLCDGAPLHQSYLNRTGLISRSNDVEIGWVTGSRLADGETIASPIDQVFYPVLPKDQRDGLAYNATSTGVAVHPERPKAIQGALFELIERDAIGVTWYGRRTPPVIPQEYWSNAIRNRVDCLRKYVKREIIFCNLTLDSIPVVMCVFKGDTYPYLTTGSSAHSNYQIAMSKALDEAELAFHSFRGFPTKKRTIEPGNVRSVTDHAILWASRAWSNQLEWLLAGPTAPPPENTCSWKVLVEKFDPAVIDLLPKSKSSLSAVRVVSKVLMPITFGYGAEHYRHPRVMMLGYDWEWSYPALPHCLS